MTAHWQRDACAALGVGIRTLRGLGGGDFAQSYQATLEDDRQVFIKTHRNPPPFFFTTEAAGLDWLRRAGAVRVPEVLGVSDDPPWLALEWIAESAGRASGAPGERGRREAEFGRALARMHVAGAPHFGRTDERTTGSLGVPNTPTDEWVDFYARCRLRPLARIARERGVLSASVVRSIEHLAGRLSEFGGSDEPPARLHGDLWAGNRIVDSSGHSWILDPAAHGGHREFDLSMMRLFGGFDSDVFTAYEEAYPLSPGWQDRVSLHQLAPLIVHAIKFGGGYIRGVSDALERYD